MQLPYTTNACYKTRITYNTYTTSISYARIKMEKKENKNE